jgi:hypothetical protein
MSHRCRNCGRNSRRRHRTVFSQGGFWTLVGIVLGLVWLYALARGQA